MYVCIYVQTHTHIILVLVDNWQVWKGQDRSNKQIYGSKKQHNRTKESIMCIHKLKDGLQTIENETGYNTLL